MQGTVALLVMTIAMQFAPVVQWSGWVFAVIAVGFIVKLRMSDPFRQLDRAMETIRKLTKKLSDAEEKVADWIHKAETLSTELHKEQRAHAETIKRIDALERWNADLSTKYDRLEARFVEVEKERSEYLGKFMEQRGRNEMGDDIARAEA